MVMLKKIIRVFFKILFFLLLFAIAGCLIYAGLYFAKISDKHYIFGEAIDQAFDKAESIFSIDNDYILGDSFQIEGTLKMELSSEEYANKGLTDIEYKKKNQVLSNLSKMDTTFLIQQDREKQQLYGEITQKIGEEEIYAGKRYINNSTQYFFVNKILSNYVNDGNNNYFETYSEEITTVDNISYLYHFIANSIKKNVTSEQLKAYDQETLIGNDTKKMGLVSYRVTDKEYKRLLKALLNDLKNDPRASQILSAGDYHIDELKVDTKKKYIDPEASYTINIYVTKTLFKLEKYEIIYLKGDQKNVFTYEGDMDKGIFYYSENAELKYRANYESTKRRMNITIYDRVDNEIGSIKGEKDKNSLMLTATVDLEHYNYDISYTSKNQDLKDSTYTREDVLVFKLMKDKVIQLQGQIEATSTISKDPKIMIDTDSSVLRSSLTENESRQLESLNEKIKERLEK